MLKKVKWNLKDWFFTLNCVNRRKMTSKRLETYKHTLLNYDLISYNVCHHHVVFNFEIKNCSMVFPIEYYESVIDLMGIPSSYDRSTVKKNRTRLKGLGEIIDPRISWC
jgi:hypothetical protein